MTAFIYLLKRKKGRLAVSLASHELQKMHQNQGQAIVATQEAAL